jgi:very-short-patch-repair endonuclease
MSGVGRIATKWRTETGPPPLDVMIARLATAQHGVIALWQLAALGLSTSAVRSRVATGKLHPVHRGVYAVGHSVLSSEGIYMAAVLACGTGAVLSHRSSADLWNLRPSSRRMTDVTTPHRGRWSRPRIEVHRVRALDPRDVACVEGIPCTNVARTLLDLAETVDRRGVERAMEQAEILRLFDGHEAADVLSRAHGRRGAPVLHGVVADFDPAMTLTRSELERLFFTLCKEARVSRPEVNARLVLDENHAFTVDFLWRDRRLVVEVDSRRYHLTRQAFESDRRRDQLLLVHGWRPARCTWRQVVWRPGEIRAMLAALHGVDCADPTDRA